SELLRRHSEARPLNANGRLVTPGLVDAHTHMIFAGHRAMEHERLQRGADYSAIASEGGGIRSTVRATAAERPEVLEKNLANRLERWRASGCTTVEVKTGYGLTPSAELRLLDLVRSAMHRVPLRVVRTALLLHAVPDEYRERRKQLLEVLVTETLPDIRRRDLASAIDAFCDATAFSVEECRTVLGAAKSLRECAAIAARMCGFTAEETLLAVTWNAAKTLGVEGEVGHLNPGASGDAVMWECDTLEELPYWMPAVRPDCVFVRGADLALPSVERRVGP